MLYPLSYEGGLRSITPRVSRQSWSRWLGRRHGTASVESRTHGHHASASAENTVDSMSDDMYTMSRYDGGTMISAVSSPVIAAKNLRKTFGSVEAVKDVSFEVEPGQVLGLLGPNGAGKTTTINMISTLLQIDAGEATVGGFDVQSHPEVVRQLIGLAGQSAAVDEKLTALRIWSCSVAYTRSHVSSVGDELRN